MKLHKNKSWILWIGLIILLVRCQNKDKDGKVLDTPTSGEITIAADESLLPIVDAEIKAFEAIYKNARINVVYGAETASFKKLLQDSVRLAIVSRPMIAEELSILEKQRIKPATLKVGRGAIALIVNNDNTDSLITINQLQALFRGEIDQWKQIDPESKLNEIKIIFDHEQASSVRYMKDSIARVAKLPPNCFAVTSNSKVIDYVSRNQDALGLIGVSWISDHDDIEAIGFLESIKVMALAASDNKEGEFYKPYQAYIAQGVYPLTNDIYIISREARTGLGSGFMSFVAGDKGQRVVLKSGLMPATMPVRIIQFDDEKDDGH